MLVSRRSQCRMERKLPRHVHPFYSCACLGSTHSHPGRSQDPDFYALSMHALMTSELARVRKELHENSWQAAAGLIDGGMGYKFGDVTRMTVKRIADLCKTGEVQGPCDEGVKSWFYGVSCNGQHRKCTHCGQNVCSAHRQVNSGGYEGGHTGCKGPECQISVGLKTNCRGHIKKCETCKYHYCKHHRKPWHLGRSRAPGDRASLWLGSYSPLDVSHGAPLCDM